MTAPRRALIVVDVQQEYFSGILQIQAPSREETLANIVTALDTAEQRELPVVVVQHQLPEGAPVFAIGSDSWALHNASQISQPNVLDVLLRHAPVESSAVGALSQRFSALRQQCGRRPGGHTPRRCGARSLGTHQGPATDSRENGDPRR
jgi:nicotinamidase-related amidase